MTINLLTLAIFFVAWLLAQIVLDIIKAALVRKQQERMIAEAYYKLTQLISSSVKDIKRGL